MIYDSRKIHLVPQHSHGSHLCSACSVGDGQAPRFGTTSGAGAQTLRSSFASIYFLIPSFEILFTSVSYFLLFQCWKN